MTIEFCLKPGRGFSPVESISSSPILIKKLVALDFQAFFLRLFALKLFIIEY
jgi:hypothetical protein